MVDGADLLLTRLISSSRQTVVKYEVVTSLYTVCLPLDKKGIRIYVLTVIFTTNTSKFPFDHDLT